MSGKRIVLLPENRQLEILAAQKEPGYSLLKLTPAHLAIHQRRSNCSVTLLDALLWAERVWE
jgi:hypothetical protein